MFKRNLLLYGDNLDFLRDQDQFPTGSIDLIYLDPPFKSDADYNVLFKDAGGVKSAAQIKAFTDTWSWDESASLAFAHLMADKHTPANLAALMRTFHSFLGHSPMLAYLTQMAVRLVHMRRILKPTGSLFLHCDPTASHYLKLILDGLFGPISFRNEIIWCYWGPGSPGQRQFSRKHDTIFWYSAGPTWTFNADAVRIAHSDKTIANYKDGLEGSGFVGADHRIHERGKIPESWWPIAIAPRGREYLGYPTQKPRKLLHRIISAASRPGDVILDPFCGCGTTIDAVETLNREHPDQRPRKWVGIDITHLAINLIKYRLARFDPPPRYDVRGEPRDLAGARQLFRDDPYQFQFWACGLVGARPAGSTAQSPKKGKKGADRGIDGERIFVDRAPQTILVQVKGGKVGAAQVRDFVGTIQRENAAMGLFITLDKPTKPMLAEAASAGVYTSPLERNVTVPKVQIVTIEQLLQGGTPRQPDGVRLPPYSEFDATVKKAAKSDAHALFQGANADLDGPA